MSSTPDPAQPDAHVRVEGPSFSTVPLSESALANLATLGYRSMTPIQAASLPHSLAGKDLIAQAKTGSGKTAAFGLSLLHRLDRKRWSIQALVLCPTRELADQVSTEIRRLARGEDNVKVLTLCGGSPIHPQITSLQHGAHVVVGTPGRVLDHVARGTLKLDGVRTLVLDEGDRMLDMGFFDDIASVAARCPVDRQTLLFSATYPEGIAEIARRFQRSPVELHLAERHAPGQIRQRFYVVDEAERSATVTKLLRHHRPVRALAFCNTKQRCRELVEHLTADGIVAVALHGDLEQRERDQVLVQFAHRSCTVLAATDVAARGLDIEGLECVINVDVTRDAEVHVHRIGRTGRVDEDGWAFTLVGPRESESVRRIEEFQGHAAEWHTTTELVAQSRDPLVPPMVTLQILAGRKDKIRAGDVLGALTGDAGLPAAQVGKITVFDMATYVALDRRVGAKALQRLSAGTIKGRAVRVRLLRPSDS